MPTGKRRSEQSTRTKLRSPGRATSVRRAKRVQFWAAIAKGRQSEEAAMDAQISSAVGVRWFREAGGMPPSQFTLSAPPLSRRYLSFEEREKIALLRAQDCGVREIGRRLQRAASSVSRELRRNAATRSGGFEYRAIPAQWHADRASRRPKPAKLAINVELKQYVQDRLAGRGSLPLVAPQFVDRRCRGMAAGTDLGSTGDGHDHGVRHKYQIALFSIFPV